jgi:small subunit ribosomal protein S3Ae
MAKKVSARARAAARKQRDKWKMKRWYTIRAPRHPWDFKQIGETIGESDEHIMGRVYEMTLQEFNGDFTKMHIILRFRVTEVVGRDALTTFIGHHHQTDHTRRQIRRYRGKVDDVVDVVSTDGYLVRLKPLIITQKRVQTSVKQAMRAKAAEVIRAFASKNTFSKIQESILGGELEGEILNAVKPIYPVKSVAIQKSQLLQEGVTNEKGPTLDDIHANEARQEAELKAKKAAAIAAAMDGEEEAEEEEVSDAPSILDAAEALEPASEKTEAAPAEEEVVEEAPAEEEVVEEAPSEEEVSSDADYSSMTVAELKELLKAAGKPVSGKKADLIARLNE